MNSVETIKLIIKAKLKLILGKGTFRSYAQGGEDVFINQLTSKIDKGFYVDVGGFHPVQYSNTYSLYKRGWKGVVIEPNPRAKSLFSVFRSRDQYFQFGVGSQSGNLQYFSFKDPAYNTFSPEQANEWQKKVQLIETIEIPVVPLKEILNKASVQKIDVLSIDVEGLDFDVLKSHDWSIPTDVVLIENHGFDIEFPQKDPIYMFMKLKDYHLVTFVGFTMIFQKTNL